MLETARLVIASSDPAKPQAILKMLNNVTREQLEWLWPGRIPLGKLTLLAGDPGLGKSFATLDIAARVSRGERWPDNQPNSDACDARRPRGPTLGSRLAVGRLSRPTNWSGSSLPF